MKLIKKLIISIIVIIAILSTCVIGGYIYVRKTYNIDLFSVANQLKILTEEVDESLYTNAYSNDDLASMQNEINGKIKDLVVYKENEGYNGYSMNFNNLADKKLNSPISLTEKQTASLIEMLFYQKQNGKIAINGKDVNVDIIQVDFVISSENTLFNIVSKIDLKPFKNDMNSFPYKYLKKYIPEYLYVSSAVYVNKLGEETLDYKTSHAYLTLNNLNKEETESLFKTLDIVLKIGAIEDLNMEISNVAINTLIGNEKNPGFAYSLKQIGAISFNFGVSLNMDWFVVY